LRGVVGRGRWIYFFLEKKIVFELFHDAYLEQEMGSSPLFFVKTEICNEEEFIYFFKNRKSFRFKKKNVEKKTNRRLN
jgi:hypothetical protein